MKLSLIVLTLILLAFNIQIIFKNIKNPNEHDELKDRLNDSKEMLGDKLVGIVSIFASLIIFFLLLGYTKSVIPYFNNNKVTILSIVILFINLIDNVEIVYTIKTHKDFIFKNKFYDMITGYYNIFYFLFIFLSLLKR